MAKKDLTAAGIKFLPLTDEGKKRYHSDRRGLYVICEPGADGAINRSFYFRFTWEGKDAWMSLGPIDERSLSDARDKAEEYRKMIRDGKDPRRQVNATAAGQMTFKQYLDKHWDDITRGKPVDDYRWNYAIGKIDAIHDMAIGAITNDDVYQAIKKFWKTHTSSAQEVLHKAGKVFRHAKARKLRADNPAAFIELEDLGLAKASEIHTVEHHNALPFAELPEFMKKLAYQPEITARCLEWCILTAARSGEAREARWIWLNADMTVITIPGEFMKGGQPHEVPLPTQLTAMLRKLPRTGEYIFPSAHTFGTDKALRPHALLTMLNRVLGIPMEESERTKKVHGCRSTFRDWAAVNRVEEDWLLEVCLAHEVTQPTENGSRGAKVRAAYQRDVMLERRRVVMQRFADFALGASNVVRLKVA